MINNNLHQQVVQDHYGSPLSNCLRQDRPSHVLCDNPCLRLHELESHVWSGIDLVTSEEQEKINLNIVHLCMQLRRFNKRAGCAKFSKPEFFQWENREFPIGMGPRSIPVPIPVLRNPIMNPPLPSSKHP